MNENIIISVTQGNLNNDHIPLTLPINEKFFPDDIFGGESKNEKGKEVLIRTDLGTRFYTDIASSKRIFRNRGDIGRFLRGRFSSGEKVCIEKISEYEYFLSKA